MFRIIMLSSTVLLSAASAASAASAQEAPDARALQASATRDKDANRDRAHGLPGEEIIVSAPYWRPQTEVLSGTSVLSGTELTRQVRPTIGETLARQPGVSGTSFGPNVSRPVLRGFQGERIRVLTDGIGSIDVSNTSVDHAPVVNPLNAQRIEVLRGPAALLYGSSAIGGVVNVIDSRIPRAVPEAPAHFDVLANYATAAQETSVTGAVDIPVTRNIVFHADGTYLNTGDMRVGGYINSEAVRAEADALPPGRRGRAQLVAQAYEQGRLPNSSAQTSEIAGGLSYIGSTGSLGVSVSRYDSQYGVPERLDFSTTPSTSGHDHGGVRLDLAQTRIDVRGELETAGFFERLRLRAAGADYRHDEIEEAGVIGTSFFNRGYEGRIEAVQRERSGWNGAIGGQFFVRNFRVDGEEKFLPENRTRQFGLFTLQSMEFGLIKAEAGARYEHSSVSADADRDLGNSARSRQFDAFSFSLGGGVAVSEGIRFGLNASRTERAPSAEELFANGPHLGTQAFEIGNPDFRKESSWGLEATLKGNGKGYAFSVAAYHNWFSNYIYDYQSGAVRDGLPVFRYAQADARYYGVEGEISADLARIGSVLIRGDLLGDYVHATIEGSGPAPRIPPLRLLGGLEARTGMFGGRVEVERAFKQDRLAAYETLTKGYTMVNASVTWQPIADNATTLILSANNLSDVEARRHASVLKDYAPLAGRDIRISARFHF